MKELIIYLSWKYEGNIWKIYEFLKTYKTVAQAKIDEVLNELKQKGIKYITTFDDNFPEILKNYRYSPYVLFYKGNIKILKLLETQNKNEVFIEWDFENKKILFTSLNSKGKSKIIYILDCGFNHLNKKINYKKELYITQFPFQTLPSKINQESSEKLLNCLFNA
ncbi:hypothetical protein [Mycoplasmopsis fermentans]|uniref:hypothetical protein n=1 Tax=Mycoplasmopsis fermentans TaxID=2115 RepID=UPI0001E33094|nr:hypothetical protein [Mycoplasmopsis fermentans]ADN68884.1 hypothetical protein MFE_02770 [Mycoplasmopsis fermentans JER]